MAKPTNLPDGVFGPVEGMSPDEIAQAEVGSLFKLQGEEFQSVEWSIFRYKTRAEMATDQGTVKEIWVADFQGELKGAELLPVIGGGEFHFRGYVRRDDGGVKLKYNERISLAGPRKNFDEPATVSAPAPVASAPVVGSADPAMLRLMERMEDRLRSLESNISQRSQGTSMKEMIEGLVALNTMLPKQLPAPANPELLAVNQLMGLVEKGIEIGQSREPVQVVDGDKGMDWAGIVREVLPVAREMLDRANARRGAPPGRPAEARSTATVLNDPPPPAAESAAAPEMSHRWATAIEAMAKAIARGDEPQYFTEWLADTLDDQEFGLLRFATLEQVNEKLQPAFEALPIFRTPQGQGFIAAVLSEIQHPPADDPGEDAEGAGAS